MPRRAGSKPATPQPSPVSTPRGRAVSKRGEDLEIWLRRHGVGSFWAPVVVFFLVCSPSPWWCASNSALLALCSTLAHIVYSTLNPATAGKGSRRSRAPTSLWLHAIRVAAGLSRWVFMPLVFLYATCNYDVRLPLPGQSFELLPGGRKYGLDMPLIHCPRLLARLGLGAFFPTHPWVFSSGGGGGWLPPLHFTAHPAFIFTAGVVLAFRCLQVALWAVAAPPMSKDGRLRIMICGDSIPPKIDGVAVRVGHLVPALLAQGHEVHIVNSIRAEPLAGAGVTQLLGFESYLYKGHSITFPNFTGVLFAVLKFRPHVIHIMDESFLQACSQVIASACLIPTVWSHHSRLDKFAQAYFWWLDYLPEFFALFILQIMRRAVASASDVHLSVGDDMALQLEHAGCGPDISNWGCGVDTFIFSPTRRSLDTGPSSLRWKLTAGRPHTPIISYCGRVAPEKRLDLLPAVATAFLACYQGEWRGDSGVGGGGGTGGGGWGGGGNKKGGSAATGAGERAPPTPPSLTFVVVGDGPYLDELKRIMGVVGPTWLIEGGGKGAVETGGEAGEGWPPPTPLTSHPGTSSGGIHTVFLGERGHSSALGALYATSDTFFSPSTCETLGQVFQESMAAGLVPVGCRSGGVPEVFDHGVEGYLFEPEDVKEAAVLLGMSLGDRAAAITAGSGGGVGGGVGGGRGSSSSSSSSSSGSGSNSSSSSSSSSSRAGAVVPFYAPPSWVSQGQPGRQDAARARVISKSWGAAYAQAESAYFRALATRWPYKPNKPYRRFPSSKQVQLVKATSR